MQRTWNLKKYDNNLVEKIMNRYNVTEIMAKLLISRNIEFDDIEIATQNDRTEVIEV